MQEKEQLLEYQKRIASLKEKEKQLRDTYLRDLSQGIIMGPPTGYPSLDKPWLKYYNFNELDKLNIKRTVYQELLNNNYAYKKDLAIEFFGTKINYEELFCNIIKTAKALKENGIKKGDYVSFCTAGIPEVVYAFYACSYLGAIGNFMTPNMYLEDMAENINTSNSKIFIVMDLFYNQIKEAIDKVEKTKVVIIPTFNSSKMKYIMKKPKTHSRREVLWNKFIEEGKNTNLDFPVNYEENMPLAVVYSSGTTGRYKGIVLSNDSFQNSAHAYKSSGVDVNRGQKFYQIIPPWVSTGLSTSVHLPLTYGSSIFMDPRFQREVFVKNVLNHKINYTVATTSMYEGFLDEKLLGQKDLSFLHYPFEGGEPLNKEVSNKIEKVFQEHNCHAKLLVGYGQCECGATISTETPATTHKDGNVGIPLPCVNIKIVDNNYNALPYETRGQILVRTDAGMLEYYNNKEITKSYFHLDQFGNKWSCTGDIGYIDKDGNLYVEGRANDTSVIYNAEDNSTIEVYNFDIENAIMQDKNVKLCDVLINNNLLTAHLVFNESFAKDMNTEKLNSELVYLQELIYEKLQNEKLVPYSFKVRENFPAAKSGKRDIKALKEETTDFIIIDKYKKTTQRLLKK